MSKEESSTRFKKGLIIRNPHRLENQFRIAEELPVFATAEAANAHYMAVKDKYLALLKAFVESNNLMVLDKSPDSLKTLEQLYFAMHENQEFGEDTITAETFETCMHVYYGEVLIANTPGLFWEAKAHFLTENAYYLSVSGELLSIAIRRLKDYHLTPGNKRRQSLYREFKKFNSIYRK